MVFIVAVENSEAAATPDRAWWQWLLTCTVLPLGLSAPFGTTILGSIALAQIRRSAGRIYGLGLALCDVLLFPLLLVDAVIWYLIAVLLRGHLMEATSKSALWVADISPILFAAVVIVVVDRLLILFAWRTACEPTASRLLGGGSTGFPLPKGSGSERQVRSPAIALIVTSLANYFLIFVAVVLALPFAAFPQGTRPELFLMHWVIRAVGSAVILVGALKMQRLESLWLARMASVTAIFIGPAYPVGLPAGLWSLVVLSRPEVVMAFRVRRQASPHQGRRSWLTSKIVWPVLVILVLAFLVVAFMRREQQEAEARRSEIEAQQIARAPAEQFQKARSARDLVTAELKGDQAEVARARLKAAEAELAILQARYDAGTATAERYQKAKKRAGNIASAALNGDQAEVAGAQTQGGRGRLGDCAGAP